MAKALNLYDGNDNAYLDFTAGIGVTSTGHCHPRVIAAAREQLGQLIHGQYALVQHPTLLALATRLNGLTPASLDRFFFSNAGTETVETAIRLARQARASLISSRFAVPFRGGPLVHCL